jgi:hypothetical protein
MKCRGHTCIDVPSTVLTVYVYIDVDVLVDAITLPLFGIFLCTLQGVLPGVGGVDITCA